MVAVNGNSNPTISDLRNEVVRLGQYRLQLAQRLADAADQLDSPGIVPAEVLIDDLRDYRQQIVRLSSALLVETTSGNDELALNDLESLIEARDYRKLTAAIVEQLSGLFHVDIPDFAPLALCHQEASRLCEMAEESQGIAPDSELDTLRHGLHPLNALIRLCDEGEKLSDNDWAQCHDDVAANYGRLLATALTRGRIQRRGSLPAPQLVLKVPPRPESVPYQVVLQPHTLEPQCTAPAEIAVGTTDPVSRAASNSIFELDPSISMVFDVAPSGPTSSASRLREATLSLETVHPKVSPQVEPPSPPIAPALVPPPAANVADNNVSKAASDGGKSTLDQMIQLIADGRLPLALQLARCLELRSASQSPVPPWLLRALILGRHLSYSKGEIARQLDEELREFRAESLSDGSDEQRLAMSFLLRGAALPAALLAGSAPALGILRSFKIAPGFSQLYNYCSRIALYGDRLSGSLVEMFRPSGTIADAAELEEISHSTRAWLQEAARKAVSYNRTSPLFLHAHWTLTAGTAIRHAEAPILWCKWQETLSLAQHLLKPVCEQADGERNWVRQEISRLSTQVRVEPIEHALKAHGQPAAGPRGIVLPTDEMHAVIMEAVAIANRWLRLSHQASAAHASPIPLEALELRDEIIKRSEGVLSELAHHRQSSESPLVKAAIACCQSAVRQIQALFDSRIHLPLMEPDPRRVLNLDLLKIPGIDLNDQWEPESDPTVIERELIASLMQPEPTWRQCFDFHARTGNHEATGRLLGLDVWSNPEERDSLRSLRDAQISACRSALNADLAEVSGELAAIEESGAWTETVQSSFQNRLQRLRDELPRVLNFSSFGRQVNQLQSAILRQSNNSWVPSALASWHTEPQVAEASRKPTTASTDVAFHSCDIFSGE